MRCQSPISLGRTFSDQADVTDRDLAEGLDLLEDLNRVRQRTRHVFVNVPDDARGVDNENRPALGAAFFVIDAVGDSNAALRMEIRQKRERYAAQTVRPRGMRRRAVDAHFQDLYACGLVFLVALAKRGDLFGSTPGEASRMERQYHGTPA